MECVVCSGPGGSTMRRVVAARHSAGVSPHRTITPCLASHCCSLGMSAVARRG